jgi:hypothetical protein
LKIVHADDWLYPECLERMVEVADSDRSVGVVSSFRLVGNHVEHESPLPYWKSSMPGRDVVRWELLPSSGPVWVTGSDTSLMFRADFVRTPGNFYDPTVWHCDTDTAYRVLMQSDFGFVHQVLTCTRRHPGALTPFSHRVWSLITRDGRLLMRYGPALLGRTEYRTYLRRWLWRYGRFLAKQVLKPSRHRQREFHEFHRREINYLLAEAENDRETRWILGCYRYLLHGVPGTRQHTDQFVAQGIWVPPD